MISMSATATGCRHWIGDQQPVLAPGRLMRRMTPSVGPVPQRRNSGSSSIGDRYHLARDDLVAAADGGDAGQDPEPACIGPPRDIGDVAAPAGRDFVKGE
jgi:hypothetical protein